jgi:alkanesulfonate monooxygenase SsuD/methylene tetrahydromethanopterin reductase-like flavin-dependent oxidoreductase (luciferase family)
MISRSSSLMSSANVGRGALSRNTKVLMSQECQVLTMASLIQYGGRLVQAGDPELIGPYRVVRRRGSGAAGIPHGGLRHLELHRAHLIDLTELDRPFVTGDLVARTTGTGTPDQVRARLRDIAAEGARGVLYGPMGDDIPRELRAFAEAATQVRSA